VLFLFKGGDGREQLPVMVPADQSTRQEKLLSYLKAAVPAVAAGWDGVKAKVKAMNDEVRAAKEAAAAAAAALEESLLTIEKVDLSGDGGVMKQVRAGAGPPVFFFSKKLRGCAFEGTAGMAR
jgi:hypothetical protein